MLSGTIQFSVDTKDSREEDNLNLNLDDVPDNQFPNLPGICFRKLFSDFGFV